MKVLGSDAVNSSQGGTPLNAWSYDFHSLCLAGLSLGLLTLRSCQENEGKCVGVTYLLHYLLKFVLGPSVGKPWTSEDSMKSDRVRT